MQAEPPKTCTQVHHTSARPPRPDGARNSFETDLTFEAKSIGAPVRGMLSPPPVPVPGGWRSFWYAPIRSCKNEFMGKPKIIRETKVNSITGQTWHRRMMHTDRHFPFRRSDTQGGKRLWDSV